MLSVDSPARARALPHKSMKTPLELFLSLPLLIHSVLPPFSDVKKKKFSLFMFPSIPISCRLITEDFLSSLPMV